MFDIEWNCLTRRGKCIWVVSDPELKAEPAESGDGEKIVFHFASGNYTSEAQIKTVRLVEWKKCTLERARRRTRSDILNE